MQEILGFLKGHLLDTAPDLVAGLAGAAALFLPIALVNLRLTPLARRWRPLFHILAALSLLAAIGARQAVAALVPAGAEGDRLAGLIGDTLLWLVGAFLAAQALRLFFWEGVFTRRHGVPPPGLLVSLSTLGVWLAAAYGVMTFVFEQPMTGLIVSSGIMFGVLGLAMQSSLSDLIGGVAISIERPFGMGDWIELDDGTLGEVVDINWRATHVLSWHNSLYIVPNNRLSNARIHNFDQPERLYGHWFRVHVPASAPPETVKRALLHAAIESPEVLDDPAPRVRAAEAGASWAYSVFVHFRSYASHYEGRDDLLTRIWAELARRGIAPSSETSELIVRRGEPSRLRRESPEELLGQAPLFAELDPETRAELVERVSLRSVPAGEEIVGQGEAGTSMFILSTGLVRVTIAAGDGPPREVAKLSSGAHFGEMSLLAHEPRTATVTAHADCRLLEIGEEAMQAVFARDPALMERMARIVSERRLMNQALAEETSQDDFAKRMGQLTAQLAGRMRAVFGGREGAGTGEARR